MKRWIVALAAMLTVASVPMAIAEAGKQSCPMMKGMHHHKGWQAHKQEMDKFLTEIGVTADQKKRMEAIHNDTKAQMKPLITSMFEQRKALMQYMATPAATEDQALAKEQAIEDIQGKMAQVRIQSMFKMKSVLTPEQQQKIAARMQQKMQEFQSRMGKHMGEHPPEGPGGPGPEGM